VGLGLATTDQALPFHRSVNVTGPSANEPGGRVFRSWSPTATHADALVHDAAWSLDDVEPGGVGLATSDHLVPFHCSSTVLNAMRLPDFPATKRYPAAMQKVGPVHETPSRYVLSVADALALGVATIDHVWPFHRSTRLVFAVAPVLIWNPTAKQLLALVHETPNSVAYRAPAGLGLATIDHALPFHRSTNVLPVPIAAPSDSPTAKQVLAFTHDTPCSSLLAGVAAPADGIANASADATSSDITVVAVRVVRTMSSVTDARSR